MVETGITSTIAVLFVAAAASAAVGVSRMSQGIKLLLVIGLWLRVLGSQLYLGFIGYSYGTGDYVLYLRAGLEYAEMIARGHWAYVIDPWFEPGWYGTSATIRITGIVLYVIGATESGAFLVYGLVGFIGIVGFWRAYERSFPALESNRYLAWIALFPSLWFWPAAVGKDTIILCGVGLATWGFAGRTAARGWIILIVGVFLVFIIRPQVAAVLVFAMALAQSLGAGLQLSFFGVIRLVLLLGFSVATLIWSSLSMGVEFYDPEEIEEYLEEKAEQTNIGGSALDSADGGVSPLLAPVNTLFRPFPWEASGFTNMLAAAEVGVLWLVVLWRRREIWSFVKYARRTPLFWLAIVFTLGYAVALGLTLTNIGMIARQRVHIFPFLFMLLAGSIGRANAAPPPEQRRDAWAQVHSSSV